MNDDTVTVTLTLAELKSWIFDRVDERLRIWRSEVQRDIKGIMEREARSAILDRIEHGLEVSVNWKDED